MTESEQIAQLKSEIKKLEELIAEQDDIINNLREELELIFESGPEV